MWFRKNPEVVTVDPELARKVAENSLARLRQQAPPGECAARMSFSWEVPYCGRPTLEGSVFCYWHFPDTRKYGPSTLSKHFGKEITVAQALEEDVRSGKSLEGAFLQACNLGGSFIKKGPNLSGAILINANLQGAALSESNLAGANLAGADLRDGKLSSCNLNGVNFASTRLYKTKFRSNTFDNVHQLFRVNFRGLGLFGFPVERMLEEYPEQAAPMYRALASYFASKSLFDDASWAAYRASVMSHRLLTKQLSVSHVRAMQMMGLFAPWIAPVQGPFYFEYLVGCFRWTKSAIFLLVTGYGERPARVVIAAVLLILVYAGLYCIPGATTGHGFSDGVYFSMITFTTLGYGDMLPRGVFRLVAGSEALAGILFTGLFLFCLGRKTVSRG